jgi:hypothetical protein
VDEAALFRDTISHYAFVFSASLSIPKSSHRGPGERRHRGAAALAHLLVFNELDLRNLNDPDFEFETLLSDVPTLTFIMIQHTTVIKETSRANVRRSSFRTEGVSFG